MVNEVKRESNLDILRIISMLLIILLHSIIHTGVLESADELGGALNLYIRFIYMLTQICVNCYVLISGYFLVESQFKFQKLIKLWMEVVFYSFILKCIFMFTGSIPISITSLLSCFIPVFTGRYWFVTIYFGMYLLSPFLNIALHAMNKREHTYLNLLLIFLMSIMISVYPSFKGMNSGAGWGLAWFVVLYCLAAWIRLYYKKSNRVVRYFLIWMGISLCVACIYCFIGNNIGIVKNIADNWYRYDSLPVTIGSLLVFIGSINCKAQLNNKYIVTLLSRATFGVYLIHDHADASTWIWGLADLSDKLGLTLFPLIQIGYVIIVWVICSIIDISREKIVSRLNIDYKIYQFLKSCKKLILKENIN